MQKIALLRVAADTGNLGFHSPFFKDGSYDYIPIPESEKISKRIKESRTYGNTKSFKNKKLIEYFPTAHKKEKYKDRIIHFDPEFDSFTYGDPSFTKKKLGELKKDDYLLLYCSLTNEITKETGLYLFAYFCIDSALSIVESSKSKGIEKRKEIWKDYKNNFHVKHEEIFIRDAVTFRDKNKGLKLVKGNPAKSKVLKNPILISHYPKGKQPYVLSKEMQKLLGNFKGKISIQRNPLRITDNKESVEKTINWLKTLK